MYCDGRWAGRGAQSGVHRSELRDPFRRRLYLRIVGLYRVPRPSRVPTKLRVLVEVIARATRPNHQVFVQEVLYSGSQSVYDCTSREWEHTDARASPKHPPACITDCAPAESCLRYRGIVPVKRGVGLQLGREKRGCYRRNVFVA